tara:strand:- start:361 stop:519 length:159 start_codon:yes stop_codon:yes gene_type:complete
VQSGTVFVGGGGGGVIIGAVKSFEELDPPPQPYKIIAINKLIFLIALFNNPF